MRTERILVGAVVGGLLLMILGLSGCGTLVLGYAAVVREEAPPLSPQLEADYRQVAQDRGVEWELLAAWDGADNRFHLPVRPQQEIFEELVERELARKREAARLRCDQHPGDPLFCPPPEPNLDPEERDQLAQAAYRQWHGLVWQHIGSHADWVQAHSAELAADLEVALRPVLGTEKAASAAELYDGYLIIHELDDADDHVTEPPAQLPPGEWKPVDGFAWPAEGSLTSRYGLRVSPIDGKLRLHAGIDLGVGLGSPIRASKAGRVVRAGWDEVFGNVVAIDHGDGYQTLYAHNSRLEVGEGDSVIQGQVISLSGSTGWSTGPHLHFEIHYGGAPVDPLLLLGR